jgi:serine phosphatase RsbU (regulator of sigma subunit)
VGRLLHPRSIHDRDLEQEGVAVVSGGSSRPPGLGWLAALQVAWDTSPASIVVALGPDHRLVYQNGAAVAMFGPRPPGAPMVEAFPETTPARRVELDTVFVSGRPVRSTRGPLDVRRDDRRVFVEYVMAPLHDPDGVVTGVVVTSVDRTGEVEAEVASNRAKLLTDLAEQVSAAADAQSALATVTRVLVPRLADVATVYVVPDVRPEPAGGVGARPVGLVADAMAITTSEALARFGPPPSPPLRADRPPWPTLSSGQAVLLPGPNDPPGRFSADPATQEWLTAVGARNLAIVPLVVAGSLTGALVLLAAADRDPYQSSDLSFLSDVAARAATAVAQVRAHRRHVQVSHDLQQALLSSTPNPPPGLEVAARYVAGVDDVEVGGDWWEFLPLSPTTVAVGVGDVAGRGIDAAVVMGHARAPMRTAVLAGLGPAHVLELLDRQLGVLIQERRQQGHPHPLFATALHAVIDLGTGQGLLSSAGHLPAQLHRPGHGVQQWATPPRPPLGLGHGGYTQTSADIPPGASLLLYTDGLVEARTRNISTGIAHLAQLLEHTIDMACQPALDAILEGMLDNSATRHSSDDVAAILMRRDQPRLQTAAMEDEEMAPRPT